MYPWQIHAAGGIVILALLVFFWFTFYGVHKFTRSISSIISHDEQLQQLYEQINELRADNESNKRMADYSSRVIYDIKPFIDSLTEIRQNSSPKDRVIESSQLIQRILDSLTTDIYFKSGEHHRCCIWGTENQYLRPLVVSSGFPGNYASFRVLDRNNSIAGRAFRTKRTQNIPDVTQDKEWARNEESRSKYKSLICIPIGEVGVLSIDGVEPMGTECEQIGELFASVILGAITEYGTSLLELEYLHQEYSVEEEGNIG